MRSSALSDTGLCRRFSFDGASFLKLDLYAADLIGWNACRLASAFSGEGVVDAGARNFKYAM